MKRAQIATAVAALLLAGCAQGGAGMDRLLGRTPSGEGPARTAYATVDRARIFSHPDASASVLGLLSLREKVTRYQSEQGFAYVAMPNVQVVVRRIDSTDITAKGKILYGAAHVGASMGELAEPRRHVEDGVRARIESAGDLFVTAVDAVPAGSGWSVRAEVTGPRVPTPKEVRAIERHVSRAIDQPVRLALRARVDLMVTSSRYGALGAPESP